MLNVPLIAIAMLISIFLGLLYLLGLPVVAFSNDTGECVYIETVDGRVDCPDVLPAKYHRRIVK